MLITVELCAYSKSIDVSKGFPQISIDFRYGIAKYGYQDHRVLHRQLQNRYWLVVGSGRFWFIIRDSEITLDNYFSSRNKCDIM